FVGRLILVIHDDPPSLVRWAATATAVVDSAAHRALARRTARESLVLLRNPGGLLPFGRDLRSLAVIGPSANVTRFGDYSGWFTRAVTPLAGITARAAPRIAVRFARGCEIVRRPPIPGTAFGPGLRGEYFPNRDLKGTPLGIRLDEQVAFNWGAAPPGPDMPALGYSVRWTATLTCPASGRRRLVVTADDGIRLFVGGRKVIDRWDARPVNTETAVVELVAGRPVRLVLEYSHQRNDSSIALGWDLEPDRALLDEAVAAARGSDACVVVVGTDRETENEGRDRPDLNLPGDKELLIASVLDANPRTVVVLVAGSAVAMPWLRAGTPAVLDAWFPGEEGGSALAEVLFGDAEPGGRLPLTFPASTSALPPLGEYDVAAGRTYMYAKEPPLFPFGFGLGYTTFRYGVLRLDRARLG
ncbi:MAG: glycoside hydrolase family 3 C-terminal domain-containing protein, partial [bacterium]